MHDILYVWENSIDATFMTSLQADPFSNVSVMLHMCGIRFLSDTVPSFALLSQRVIVKNAEGAKKGSQPAHRVES